MHKHELKYLEHLAKGHESMAISTFKYMVKTCTKLELEELAIQLMKNNQEHVLEIETQKKQLAEMRDLYDQLFSEHMTATRK